MRCSTRPPVEEVVAGAGQMRARARPELDALVAALAAADGAVLDRLDQLERRLAGLERPDWLTLDEAAGVYRTTPDALRKRAQRGALAGAVKDGARWLVDRRALDAALAAATIAAVNSSGRAPRARPRPRHRR
jgi:hypothetical protein